jgi:hypothetical protein
MKFLILFQVGSIDIGCEIVKYIYNFISSYNIFFLCSVLEDFKTQISILTNLFEKYQLEYKIVFHINKGMDIGPYLLQLNYICSNYFSNSFDQIFKIHTKTDIKWRNEMLDQIFQPFTSYTESTCDISSNIIYPESTCDISSINNKWLLPLDKLNVQHINLLCEQFRIPNIYYDVLAPVDYNNLKLSDISLNFYSNYYNIKLKDCSSLNNLLGYDYNLSYLYLHCIQNKNIPNPSYIIKSRRNPNVKFYAGSIFKISYYDTWEFFSKIDIIGIYNLLEPGYTINNNSTYVHSMERIISGFLYNI